MKKTEWLAAACAVVAVSAGLTAGGKTPPAPKATVTFANTDTTVSPFVPDNIQGDGKSYVGGVNGVVSELQPGATPDGSWTGPTNLLLNIATTNSRPKRFLLYRYPESAKIDLSSQPSSSSWPCGYYEGAAGPASSDSGVKVYGFMNIHSLGQMQIGEARAVRIHFGADTGQFLWLSPQNVATGSCSSTVFAWRQSQTTWAVATSISRVAGATALTEDAGVRYDAADNVYEVRGTDPSIWNRPSAVAQLDDAPSRGNYVMPFALSISCPTCPLPPPCAAAPCAIKQ